MVKSRSIVSLQKLCSTPLHRDKQVKALSEELKGINGPTITTKRNLDGETWAESIFSSIPQHDCCDRGDHAARYLPWVVPSAAWPSPTDIIAKNKLIQAQN